MSAVSGVAIKGISTVVPTTVAKTADYEYLTTEERQRFESATGISERRIVKHAQCTSDLCGHAADRLMSTLGWERTSIGALVMITQTGDHPVPATSIILQHKLRLRESCVAFDVNLGCSSYPYGLAIVSSLMKTLGINRALLLIGDVSSKLCAKHDKSAWPLFGDAGTATALELDSAGEPMVFDLMSDGAGKDAIIIPTGGLASRRPLNSTTLNGVESADGILRNDANLVLKGSSIFSFAISKVPPSIKRVLSESKCEIQDIDYLVLHQANKMINDTIRKKVASTEQQCLSTLRQYGNTSSASIPLTICSEADRFTEDKDVMVCGFGVGLSWGAAKIKIAANTILPIFECDDEYQS